VLAAAEVEACWAEDGDSVELAEVISGTSSGECVVTIDAISGEDP
jgi:hypothetical protein